MNDFLQGLAGLLMFLCVAVPAVCAMALFRPPLAFVGALAVVIVSVFWIAAAAIDAVRGGGK